MGNGDIFVGEISLRSSEHVLLHVCHFLLLLVSVGSCFLVPLASWIQMPLCLSLLLVMQEAAAEVDFLKVKGIYTICLLVM